MQKIAIVALCSILAACGGGGSNGPSSGPYTNSTTLTTGTLNYTLWSPSSFSTPATPSASITFNTPAGSIALTSPSVSVYTPDNWTTIGWSGTTGTNNFAAALGNILRICTAGTAAGTSVAVSPNMTAVTNIADLNGLTAKLQDCTVANPGQLSTLTFNADGTATSSTGATLTASQVTAFFSASGYTDSTGTYYAQAYYYVINGYKQFFLVKRLDTTVNGGGQLVQEGVFQ
jgi:hypothetical protein